MTLRNISAVLFSNILNMKDKKNIKLIFTALTAIFVPCSGSERLRQVQDLQPFKWFNMPGTAQRLSSIWGAPGMIFSGTRS